MNIKLNAKLKAYTKSREFQEVMDEIKAALSFIDTLPEEDGEYTLLLTVQNGNKTFSWLKNQEEVK